MLQTRRNLAFLTRRLVSRQQRRYDSSNTSSGHAASAGQTNPTHHPPHPEPVNESLGRGFYITLAAVPLSFALYKFSVSSADNTTGPVQPAFTRLITYYSNWNEKWIQRNALHTSMAEQAAHDRNLFHNSRPSQHVDLQFPEIFNTGSPYNVPAGHSANLDELIAHYKKQNAMADEAREARAKAVDSGKEPKAENIVRSATF